MKTFLKIFAGLAVVAVLGVGAVFYMTGGMVDAAQNLLTAASRGAIPDAKQYLSQGFLSSVSEQQLEAFFTEDALANYESASWSSRSIEGGQGELSGSITTKSGGSIPVEMQFVKEEGDWKLNFFKRAPAGIAGMNSASQQTVPGADQQIALVRDSISRIAQALAARQFDPLHAEMSEVWKSQFDVTKLEQMFAGFVEQELDLRPLNALRPVQETQDALDANGALVLNGVYQTTPNPMTYTFKYISENGEWKMYGMAVNFVEPSAHSQD